MKNTNVLNKLMFLFQIQVNAKGCDLHMNRCDNQHTLYLPDLCKIANQKSQIWNEAFTHIHPKMNCPLKPPNYRFVNATMDISFISHLPLDGFIWTITIKTFKPIPNIRHKKRMVFCLMAEGSILRVNRKPK